MSFQSHPFVMSHVVALRHAELRAEADRYRLAQRAEKGATPRSWRANLTAALTVVLTLPLFFAEGSSVPRELRRAAALGVGNGETHAATRVVNERLLDPGAVERS